MKVNEPLFQQLAGKGIYESTRFATPTAERQPHVLQTELTVGCSHNKCTFCDFYKGEDYRVKSGEEYASHLDALFREVRRIRGRDLGLKKIFIEGGNALSVPTPFLNKALQHTISEFMAETGGLPERVSMYAHAKDLAEKSSRDLKTLHCGGVCGEPCSLWRYGNRRGLDLVYFGMETGSDALLRYVAKGNNRSDLLRAIDNVNGAYTRHSKLRTSVFIMPGLGGVRFWREHVADTMEAIARLRPDFINFLGIEEHECTPYTKLMRQETSEGTNRPLTRRELVQQTAEMISQIYHPTTVSCFQEEAQPIGTNPFPVGSVKLRGNDPDILAAEIFERVRALPEEAFAREVGPHLFTGSKKVPRSRGQIPHFNLSLSERI